MSCVLAGLVVLSACSDAGPESIPVTVGSLPEPADPGTLLPVVVETAPPQDGTAPPGALFGGNLCTALTDVDLAAVNVGGDRGELVGDPAATFDGCDYTLEVGSATVHVVVTARSQADFASPAFGDEAVDELDGLGEAARGVERSNGYEVYVKVSNGWFSVLAPTEASARALAVRAVPRATP